MGKNFDITQNCTNLSKFQQEKIKVLQQLQRQIDEQSYINRYGDLKISNGNDDKVVVATVNKDGEIDLGFVDKPKLMSCQLDEAPARIIALLAS